MSEREENVYKAKLAEQAERYDGEFCENEFFLSSSRLRDHKKKKNKNEIIMR